jgi:uncharacterized protein YdeI (YjbR/CyaY-like superfamily)
MRGTAKAGGGAMIVGIEDYFSKGCCRCDRFDTAACSARLWSEGLARLRGLCRAAGLVETVKWGHPCYMHAGRNVAILGAFRAEFRISFFEAALLDDPGGLLERQGPNTRVADAIRFRDNAAPAAMAGAVTGFLRAAMADAEAGRRAPRPAEELDLPEDLIEALKADPVLAEAFAGLTPGRRRSYVIALSSARTSATRIARIARFRERILAGRGATER